MIRDVVKVAKPKKVQCDHGASLKVAKAIFGVGSSQLARDLGVSAPAIDKICRTKTVNPERLAQLAEFFGLSVGEFEALAYHALSESVLSDSKALNEYLCQHYPEHSDHTKQINRYYQKIIHLLNEIEDVV